MRFSDERKFHCPTAEEFVFEAHRLANLIVESQLGKTGAYVDVAIKRAEALYGFEPGVLHSLRYRWHELKNVKGSVLERLRAAYEVIYERDRKIQMLEAQIEKIVETKQMEMVE